MSGKHGDEIGHDLREGSSVFLQRRRGILGLTLFSSAVLAGVALYQTGILRKLPQPPWCSFNTEKVHGSSEAYSILSVPDGLLGLASYAVTACLVGAGPANRSRTHSLLPIIMGMKLLGDAVFAGKLTLDECKKIHAFSVWSLLVAGATFTALPLGIPETKAALPHWFKK